MPEGDTIYRAARALNTRRAKRRQATTKANAGILPFDFAQGQKDKRLGDGCSGAVD